MCTTKELATSEMHYATTLIEKGTIITIKILQDDVLLICDLKMFNEAH